MVLDSQHLFQPQSSSGQSVFRRLTFVPATKPDAHSAPTGVDLTPLNETPQMPALPAGKAGPGPSSLAAAAAAGPKRQRELFREADVVLQWTTVRNRGAGFHNLGNTCFMNSVLQALVHTPPLAELFLSQKGERLLAEVAAGGGGGGGSNDPVGLTLQLVRRCFTTMVLSPKGHAQSLRLINKRFRLGRQEDSHEFLRCLLDAMHEACLRRFKPKPPPELANTTFVYRIFGGRLRSQIECEGVDYVSRTYDPFLDLSLEIIRAPTLERALGSFTAPEVLDGANKYRCPKNNKLVRAVKRISVEEAPNVLTVHLKRFEYGGFGAKINRKVDFPTQLDLRPYMSNAKGSKQLYDLYGVLVHHGHTVNSGHYICYVKAANGLWHVCDDHRVTAVGERTVLEQRAYILFYIRRHPRDPAVAAAQQAVQSLMRASVSEGALPKPAISADAGGGRLAQEAAADGSATPVTAPAGLARAARAVQEEASVQRPAKRAKKAAQAEEVTPAAPKLPAVPVAAAPAANGGLAVKGAAAKQQAAAHPIHAAPGSFLAKMIDNLQDLKRGKPGAKLDKEGLLPRVPKLKAKVTQQLAQQQHPEVQEKQQQQQPEAGSQAAQQQADVGGDVAGSTPAPCGQRHAGMASANGDAEETGTGTAAAASVGDGLATAAEHSLLLSNGKEHRSASALKRLHTSPALMRGHSSVWYAAAGRLRHNAVAKSSTANPGKNIADAGTPGTSRVALTPHTEGKKEAGLPPLAPANGYVETSASGRTKDTRPEAAAGLKRAKRLGAMASEHIQAAAAVAGSSQGKEEGKEVAPRQAGVKRPRKEQSEATEVGNGHEAGDSGAAGAASAAAGKAGERHEDGPANGKAKDAEELQQQLTKKQLKKLRRHQQQAEDSAAATPMDVADTPASVQPSSKPQKEAVPSAKPQKLAAATPTVRPQAQPSESPMVITGADAIAWLTGGAPGAAGMGRDRKKPGLGGSGHADDGAAWDEEAGGNSELRRQAAQINRELAGTKRRTPAGGRDYDEWDEEYDKGRTKKIRSKDGEDGDEDDGEGRRGSLLRGPGNMFQKAASEGWRSDQKSGPGGPQRGRSPGGRGRSPGGRGRSPGGRGRGGFGGRGRGGFGGRGGGGGRGRGGGRGGGGRGRGGGRGGGGRGRGRR
ncbi:hypothetical protein Agub_g5470 [Astrephomene gubernaculifera]|uniref:ubiquitinyl hydrolase 1 n=1 Tax=Astrephomene gubernaculifera TaxID=47775 RepID=A0AAD3DLW4_9CHLO|nr:hypothetical protein Agub_g5470 [Astrephomene gubernaculifera]